MSMPHISPFNYFLADRDDMLVVEAHPEMSDLLYAIPPNSAARLDFLVHGVTRLVETSGLTEASSTIAALMADHSIPVCWHTETMATLWSAVASPASGHIRYALGAPCRTAFQPASQ